jgi:hypothetical protein
MAWLARGNKDVVIVMVDVGGEDACGQRWVFGRAERDGMGWENVDVCIAFRWGLWNVWRGMLWNRVIMNECLRR